MKKKTGFTLLILICLFIFFGCNETEKEVNVKEINSYTINALDDIICVTENETDSYVSRSYKYQANNADITMYRALRETEISFDISKTAEIRYSLDGQSFIEQKITDRIKNASCYYIDDNDVHLWIYMPKQYKVLENQSLEYLPKSDGELNIKKNDEGYTITISTKKVKKGAVSDFMISSSANLLFDWHREENKTQNFMKAYNLDKDGRWCYDGYYFVTDSSYVPSGENVYHFLVDAYIIPSFISGSLKQPGCKLMLAPMIDTMLSHQTEEGYLPTYSLSTWLKNDYDIDKEFYDTRFNTDFFMNLIKAFDVIGGDFIKEATIKYANFFINHANKYSIDTKNGFYVADYYSPKKDALTHASLNHNLAEIELCLMLSDFLEDSKYEELAFNILNAIEDIGVKWIMADSNLEYAILPDYSFGFVDYPYLTYNDLYDVQSMLENRGYGRNLALEALMDAKLIYMKANGIEGYKK